MTLHRAGTEVQYTVTFLEMAERPSYGWPVAPAGMDGALLRAEAPPVWYFLALYDAVGRDYAWTDIHDREHDDIATWLADPDVALWSLIQHGWPHGFFVLDFRAAAVAELAYFGLVPQVVGRGFGSWLLRTAVLTAWERPGLEKLCVNTCTLDHPRALVQYQRFGFSVVRREEHSRMLTRDIDFSRIPD